jgi:hypothetical protein
MHVGYTRYDNTDAPCNQERAAAVERELSSDDVEARMSVAWSRNEHLFGDSQVQDPQSDRDTIDARVEISEQTMDDSNICEQSQVEDGDKRAEEPVVNQVSDPEDSILD